MKRIRVILLAVVAMVAAMPFLANSAENQLTPVQRHGALAVKGRFLVDNKGEKVQLRGVSFGWHNWWHRYFNEGSVDRVANDWGASIVRCSIGLNLDDQCFDKKPELAYATVDRMVEAAVKHGVYVLVDFHSHKNNLPLAKEFFKKVTAKYGKVPNVLYEIWNEPEKVKWAECKAYSEELLPIIRKNAPDAVVIIPTPRWDQEVNLAADDPIKGYSNLMYSVHYYASTHKDDIRANVKYAISKNLPVFFAETGGMDATGNGVFDIESWEAWLKLADDNSISWIAWSISDKVEGCSMLVPNTPADGRQWTEAHLKPWAVLVRHYLQIKK